MNKLYVAARPPLTVATESWPPNVPVAARRLAVLRIPIRMFTVTVRLFAGNRVLAKAVLYDLDVIEALAGRPLEFGPAGGRSTAHRAHLPSLPRRTFPIECCSSRQRTAVRPRVIQLSHRYLGVAG